MTRFAGSLAAVAMVIGRGSYRRPMSSLATVLGVAVSLLVVLVFFALTSGLRHTVEMSGSERIAVWTAGAGDGELNSRVSREQVNILQQSEGLQSGPHGPVISPEIYMIVGVPDEVSGSTRNVPLRGVGPNAGLIRSSWRLLEGRWPHSGKAELIVSRDLAGRYRALGLGEELGLRGSQWTIVGIFDAGGTVYDSEIWADIQAAQGIFRRNDAVQSVRAALAHPDSMSGLVEVNDEDDRLLLNLSTEREFFARQAAATRHFAQVLAWPLAIVLAVAAAAAAMSALYASVQARRTETSVLRILGFSKTSLVLGSLAESVLLCLVGMAVAALAAFVFVDGASSHTMSSEFAQAVFRLDVSAGAVQQALWISVVIGLAGGLMPALKSVSGTDSVVVEE